MMTTKNVKPLFYACVFAATFGFGIARANAQENQNRWVQSSLEDGSYCHLKFPAISEGTLFTRNPQLEDPSLGDMVDYYGPCDHDPLGQDEVESQRLRWERNVEADEG